MSGSITRKQQPVPITTTIEQAAGQTLGATSIADGTELPLVFLLDENNPDRKISPADETTQQSVLTKITALTAAQRRGSKTFSQVTVTSAAILLLAANANRLTALLSNTDPTNTIYLGVSAAVTITTGTPLYPNQTYEDPYSTDAWYAIAATGVSVDSRVEETA